MSVASSTSACPVPAFGFPITVSTGFNLVLKNQCPISLFDYLSVLDWRVSGILHVRNKGRDGFPVQGRELIHDRVHQASMRTGASSKEFRSEFQVYSPGPSFLWGW